MKDPKEYAKELVEKYLRIEDDTMFFWDGYYDRRMFDEQVLDHAIKCALIDVQNTIDYHESLFDNGFEDVHIALSSPVKTYIDILNPLLKWLQQVKTEIINLK